MKIIITPKLIIFKNVKQIEVWIIKLNIFAKNRFLLHYNFFSLVAFTEVGQSMRCVHIFFLKKTLFQLATALSFRKRKLLRLQRCAFFDRKTQHILEKKKPSQNNIVLTFIW